MAITRTIEVDDLTPAELASLFCGMEGGEQAEFFRHVHLIARTWPGAGWCQQSYSIAADLTPEGREVVTKLAEHVLDCDDLLGAVAQSKVTLP